MFTDTDPNICDHGNVLRSPTGSRIVSEFRSHTVSVGNQLGLQ